MYARPLIIRCGALGDVVMLTTLLRLVAARYGSPVDVVGQGDWTEPLLRHEPALGELRLLTSRNTPYWLNPSQWALVRWLKQRGHGPVYFCDGGGNAQALLRRAGIGDESIVRRLLSDDETNGSPHPWPDRWLSMGQRSPVRFPAPNVIDAAPFRLPRLIVTDAERADLAQWMAARGVRAPCVLFQPGNKRTHKRGKMMTTDHPKHWNAANWAAVAQAIWQDLPDAQVLLCGSPKEKPLLEDIRAAAGHDPRLFNLADDLPVPRLLALIEHAHSMVSVDTGPAHAAAALGCPLVVMFGAASPQKWRPIGHGAIRVLGGEKGDRSRVGDIPVDAVVAAWKGLGRA
ncbi:MAG: glycosyltransferase family 9 protein [Pseudoxanthomonas sp.]